MYACGSVHVTVGFACFWCFSAYMGFVLEVTRGILWLLTQLPATSYRCPCESVPGFSDGDGCLSAVDISSSKLLSVLSFISAQFPASPNFRSQILLMLKALIFRSLCCAEQLMQWSFYCGEINIKTPNLSACGKSVFDIWYVNGRKGLYHHLKGRKLEGLARGVLFTLFAPHSPKDVSGWTLSLPECLNRRLCPSELLKPSLIQDQESNLLLPCNL